MSPEDQAKFDDLASQLQQAQSDIADLQAQMLPLQNIKFAEESGGGDVVYGEQDINLRPFASTPVGVQRS